MGRVEVAYLDTNIYCRPFDDQRQIRIREETDAFEAILDMVREGRLILLSSDILKYEVLNIFSPFKKAEIEKYLSLCKRQIEEDGGIKDLAIMIRNKCSIKDRDALHLASAIMGEAAYYLTCDDYITKKKSVGCIKNIAGDYEKNIIILNPKDFASEIGG